MKDALKKLGELATMNDIQKYFKVSRNHIYRGIDERKILTFKTGKKVLIMTKTILNLLRK